MKWECERDGKVVPCSSVTTKEVAGLILAPAASAAIGYAAYKKTGNALIGIGVGILAASALGFSLQGFPPPMFGEKKK